MAWREDITLALQNLGGEANLNDIYNEILKLKDGKVTRYFDATVRQTIETASSDSRVWKEGNPDLFKKVSYGRWALRETEKFQPSSNEIPYGITKDDVLNAIQDFDSGIENEYGESIKYDLLHAGKKYPPKAIVGLAARRVNGGMPLKPYQFKGGAETAAFRLLKNFGFVIEEKNVAIEKRYWIEKTLTKNRPDRLTGPDAVGHALWSPQTSKNGSDIYSNMKEAAPGDVVFHLTDNAAITTISVVNEFADDTFRGVPGSDWEGRPGYRIPLMQAINLSPPLLKKDLMGIEARPLLTQILNANPKMFFNSKFELNQGAYLTKAPAELVKLFDQTYFRQTGKHLPHVEEKYQTHAMTQNPTPKNYWAIGVGENGRHWDEFQETGIVAIGKDIYDLGPLDKYPSREDIAAAMAVKNGMQASNPSNDSLCAYQFAHEMKIGDIVVAKIGSKKILGVGIVQSKYIFDSLRSEYKHIRYVTWMPAHRTEFPVDLRVAIKTLTNITPYPELVSFIEEQVLLEGEELQIFDAYTRDDALNDIFIHGSQLDNIVASLQRKKNVILQGPPGVGKTYFAKRLAYLMMGEKDSTRFEMVQFHQSYSYEDFVQGWRPTAQGGFTLKSGIFFEFCDRARSDHKRPYVFVIDEINRGNLSKIFGELMMLIETDKRGLDFAIPLTYSENSNERFSIPENVYLVGLMNTADRSLALVDYALRRRFAFYTLEPRFESQQFENMLIEAGASDELVTKIRSRIGDLNDQITEQKRDLGPSFRIGHSFFCVTKGTVANEAWYEFVINTEIAPLVLEYWFDDQEKANAIIEDLLA